MIRQMGTLTVAERVVAAGSPDSASRGHRFGRLRLIVAMAI
jgi:hypothetical protein